MVADQQLTIFISYSRADSEFVDRLDADLRARGYRTWVDRHRLEGGVDWEREISAAIAACGLFLISISQSAVDSQFVEQEFKEASRLSKRIIPLLYRDYSPTHPWINAAGQLNWVEFKDAKGYELSLKRLLYAIQDPTLDLNADDSTLYNRALVTRASDPERAAIIFQHLVDRTPTYFGGQAQRDLADLETQLYASRVARLRAQAEQARREGQYGVEAASLEALLALGDRDAEASAWTREYLPIAQQNRGLLGPYNVILQRIADGDTSTARSLLQNLWKQAPYFRDPANIAPTLSLTLPPTYAHDQAVAAEQKRYERACAIMSSDLSARRTEDVRVALRYENYDINDEAMSALIDQRIHFQYRNADLAEKSDTTPLRFSYDVEEGVYTVLFWLIVAILVRFVIYQLIHWDISFGLSIPNTWEFFLVVDVPAAVILSVYAYRNSDRYRDSRKERLKRAAAAASAQADAAYQEWRRIAWRVCQQRIAAINQSIP